MTKENDSRDRTLRRRLLEAEDMLRAIRDGEVDAVVVEGTHGNQVYTLHSAEEPYRTLVEQMQEGAVILSSRGDIVYCNTRFAALVGEPPESVVGRRLDQFACAADRADFEDLLRIGSGRRRIRLRRAGSDPFEASVSVTTTASANGDHVSVIVSDLRELLEARDHRALAERQNRTKDEFLATIAHELRNPLTSISGAVQLLELRGAPEPPAVRARAVIERQVANITRLIDDLLDIERVVSGKIRLQRKPVDMAEAVRRTVAAIPEALRADRQSEVTLESVWVAGDVMRLEQIVSNLVTNAFKYTRPGGRIRVALRAEGGDAVLSVDDDGLGIAPRLLPFVFDMYVQADRTLDQAKGGLGIGLSLTRRLVELHGGTIVASSEGEGRGSRFVVRLAQSPATGRLVHARAPQDRRASPRRVLIIEDSAEARATLRAMLELAGHVVYEAPDAIGALALLNVARPDVGIIDMSLPDLAAYQVAKRVRSQPHGRNILLLALTDGDTAAEADRSLECGFDHRLVKPVDPAHLARLIVEGGARADQQISPP